MEKIKKLKQLIIKEQLDGYIIPKNNEFFNEYVSPREDRLKYISNFSGSYGFALILKDKNYLFVDGRYTLQATNQSGKFFKIITFPKNMPKDISINKNLLIGFDPKFFTKKVLNTFFPFKKFKLKPLHYNLIDKIWVRKLKKNYKKFYCLPKVSVGESYKSKIDKIVSQIKKRKADFQFITACENNAWLLNIRGGDTQYAPIPHCHILINKNKKIKFFCDLKKIGSALKKNFNRVEFIDLSLLSSFISEIVGKKFIIDSNTCSIFYENLISNNNVILNFHDPIYQYKAIKNNIEIRNIQKAHICDGVALTKYLFWVKKNFNKKKITEISGSEKLYRFRKQDESFKFSSFPTISGSGPNGAIIHYKATKKTNRTLKTGDIYLVDSGGQYEFGTTDVTRTISLRNSNKRIKNIFTRILQGHIAVASFKLKKNSSGSKIDYSARKFLKKVGLDYSHGTGHGVGYFLNVHEGPHAIAKNNSVQFQDGMVVSNEPGYYEKNRFGIRIENLIYVKNFKNKKFFENFTLAPIDKDLIDKSLLSKNEINWLNNYHKRVFNNLKYKMNKIEIIELKKACSAI